MLFFLLLVFAPGTALADQKFSWENSISPSELHAMMAEKKAEALARSRYAQTVTAAEVLSTQTNYDVLYYDLYIRVNDTTQILYGRNTIAALAAEDAVSAVEVDLHTAMTVDSIVSGSGPLGFTRSGDVVTVTLDQAYDTGEPFEFDIWYFGHPTEGGLQAFDFSSYGGRPMISSLSEPYFARTWWPCKDRMDDKPDSMDIAIEVDTSFYVGSNGLLDSTVAAGPNSHTYYWRVRYPIVTYLFSVSIYPYTVWEQDYVYNGGADTMPIVHAVFPDQYTTSLTTWGQSPEMIDILSASFGPYPFLEEKYGHANFLWGGGMEHQTMTSMIGNWFGFHIPTIVHELSHQWWGDMITCLSWEDIWLNEGWASYSEAVYYLYKEGWSSYRSYMNGMRYTGGGTVWCDDTTSVNRIFSPSLSYDKGAWVVHMLRGVLGEAKFSAGVSAYYNSQYQYGAASTENFKDVFEAATGDELDWFFEDWVYGTYYPNYWYYYMTEPNDTGMYDVYVVIKQTQTTSPQVFRMPVDLYLDYAGTGGDTAVVWADERQKRFKLVSPVDLDNVGLDPAGWILKAVTPRAWELFIVSLEGDLANGLQYAPYTDTVEYRGGSSGQTVTIIDGALPTGYTIDNTGRILGSTNDTGLFTFTVKVKDNLINWADSAAFSIRVEENLSCCIGSRGNIQLMGECNDVDQSVDVGDLTDLIDHLFINFTPLCCVEEADLMPESSPDGQVDVSDLTELIDFLFINFQPLADCF